jgi:hypothetical protein
MPEHEAEDRPRVEAVVEAARLIESIVGLPGVWFNLYKLYAYTDGRGMDTMGMCTSYIYQAARDAGVDVPTFTYSAHLRQQLADVCYEDTKDYLFHAAWEEAGGMEDAGGGMVAGMLTGFANNWFEPGVAADMLANNSDYLRIFARNGANQIVNTFLRDDSDNISHDWADYAEEEFGVSTTVSPDNVRPTWLHVENIKKNEAGEWEPADGERVDGWGRPWGHEKPIEYELGAYRGVRRDGGEAEPTPATTAGRFKLVLIKLKCDATEEDRDEVYLIVEFKDKATGRMIHSYTTSVYKDLSQGQNDDPDDGEEADFNDADRANVGWMDINDGVTVKVRLYERDNGRGDWVDPDDLLGRPVEFEVGSPTIPAGSVVLIGEPPGRERDDHANWTFHHGDANPLVSDYKYRIWYQTIYVPAR